MDLLIPPPLGVALELTRDSDRLQDHLERFNFPAGEQPAGSYFPIISSGGAMKWAVVDCVSPGKDSQVQHSSLYTVKMSDSWARAQIWHMGEVKAEVLLAGDVADKQQLALADTLKALQLH